LLVLTDDAYPGRFSAWEYEEDEPVDVRAHRGSRRASVRREHAVPERLFARIISLADAYELHLLPTLDVYGPFELDQRQAQTLVEELDFLQPVVNDELLAAHLAALHDVALWCVRSGEDAWMHIEGP
jgi:hypothetical protein